MSKDNAMGPSQPERNEPDEHIARLINEYFDRRQSGEALTPESFAAEHPQLGETLQPYLEGLALLDKVRPAARGDVGESGTADGAAELPRIEGYRLLEEIGRGGMGVVYRALQLSTKRVVTLKVMLAGPFASTSGRRRFEREVELAARLQHPNIVRVLESGRIGLQQYYSMDYVSGVTLDRYLADAQPDLRTTLSVFERFCQAVEYAHGHGVIHRDLKPGNVLVDDDGEPHILDFGLAKATDQGETEETPLTAMSTPGQVMGSLPYLSPEQAAGRSDEVDGRTDVYSLGVMLFEALTGSFPIDTSGRPSEVLERIVETPPTLPSSLSTCVDGECETIILKAIEKTKDRRYQCAADLGADIRRYLEGEPILAKRPSSFYVLRKKVLKHRWGASASAGVVLLVVVVVVGGFRRRHHELAEARLEAVRCQRVLDVEADPALGGAEAIYARYPKMPEARLVWAQAQYRNRGARERGILFLERILENHPSSWTCRALLAEVYRATGNPGRAEALQTQADREAPDTAEAWYLRSFATLDLLKARRYAHEAVTREPSHALAWIRLVYLCFETGDLSGALQGTDRLLQLGQDRSLWTFFKGQVLARQGRFEEAVEQYTRVLDLDPRQWNAHLYRAHAYRRLKEYERAIADYNMLIGTETGDTPEAWHLYQRATPLWILGRTREASEDYRQVRLLLGRPSYADARRFLILRELGQDHEAEEVLDAALGEVEEPWLSQIFRCLAGHVSPESLINDAVNEGDTERVCEAYYYAAEVSLGSAHMAEARQWFEKSVQTGVEFDPDTARATPMNEYELASWRLEILSAETTSSAPEEN